MVESVGKRWRCFLECSPFEVWSDHAALERKLHKGSQDPPLNDHQSRWIEILLPLPLTFKYVPGHTNVVADALSRCPAAANTVILVKSLWAGLLSMMRIAADQDPDYVAKRAKCDQEGSEDVVHQGLIRTP